MLKYWFKSTYFTISQQSFSSPISFEQPNQTYSILCNFSHFYDHCVRIWGFNFPVILQVQLLLIKHVLSYVQHEWSFIIMVHKAVN